MFVIPSAGSVAKNILDSRDALDMFSCRVSVDPKGEALSKSKLFHRGKERASVGFVVRKINVEVRATCRFFVRFTIVVPFVQSFVDGGSEFATQMGKMEGSEIDKVGEFFGRYTALTALDRSSLIRFWNCESRLISGSIGAFITDEGRTDVRCEWVSPGAGRSRRGLSKLLSEGDGLRRASLDGYNVFSIRV